jgi:predicted RecB family endonuclease
MLDYWWIDKDLIDTDPKAMGVYLALLYLRLQKRETFTAKPSGLDIMNEPKAQVLFAFYLVGKGEDMRIAFDAAVTFIDRLFTHENVLERQKRDSVLEDIECRYYPKFVSAFKKYLRLNAISEELRRMAKNVLLDVRSQLYVKAITRCGTVEVSGYSLEWNINKYYGMKDEEVKKLVSNLIKSGLIYQEYYLSYTTFIIPSPCLSDEIIELVVKGGVKPEVKPPTPSPMVPISERVENLVRARPSREVLEGIVASVLENLGFRVSTNVKLEARRGSPIEVDVWAQRMIGRTRFSIYVSCKNWDGAVDRSVVDEEAGRIINLRDIPQLKVLVARELTEPAKEAAEAYGFMVIELGRKAEAENSKEIYEIVYRAFNELFTAIAPPRLREIAEKLAEIREDLRGVEEEITRLLYR